MFAITEHMVDIGAQAIHRVACGGEPWSEARIADRDQHRAEARAALVDVAAQIPSAEAEWQDTLHNDGTHEFTQSSDCDGTNVTYWRRSPRRVIDAGQWEKVDPSALPEAMTTL